MSFYTSLCYYRPSPPPPITASDLAQFIARIRDAQVLTDSGIRLLQVSFGESIDQDDRGSSWEEELPSGISLLHEIEWDIDLSDDPSVSEILAALEADSRRIYRAFVMLGQPTDAVLAPITRENSPENEINFYPEDLSIEIGPIECFHLASEQPLPVGWLSLELSGGGYLYPWTLRDALDRLHNTAAIRRLMETCRSFWPVEQAAPEPRIVELRKQFPELWPYESFDLPWDWYWGVEETG